MLKTRLDKQPGVKLDSFLYSSPPFNFDLPRYETEIRHGGYRSLLKYATLHRPEGLSYGPLYIIILLCSIACHWPDGRTSEHTQQFCRHAITPGCL